MAPLWGVPLAGHLQMVQIAIERKQTTSRRSTQFDTQLFEGSADPVGSQLGIFREFFDLVDGSQGDFLSRVMRSRGFIVQPGKMFFGSSFACDMHGLPTHVKVACNRLGVPSLRMQRHYGTSSLKGIINLGIVGKATRRA